jgi:hypothetical protein
VLIDADRHAMLADFGLCVIGEATSGKLTQTASNMEAGHICYLAPERFNPDTQGNRWQAAVDVYAFACMCILVRACRPYHRLSLMLFKLFTSRHPFQGMYERSQYAVMFAVSKGDRPPRPNESNCLLGHADGMWSLIQDCWHQDPGARPEMISVHQRLQSGWNPYPETFEDDRLSTSHLISLSSIGTEWNGTIYQTNTRTKRPREEDDVSVPASTMSSATEPVSTPWEQKAKRARTRTNKPNRNGVSEKKGVVEGVATREHALTYLKQISAELNEQLAAEGSTSHQPSSLTHFKRYNDSGSEPAPIADARSWDKFWDDMRCVPLGAVSGAV